MLFYLLVVVILILLAALMIDERGRYVRTLRDRECPICRGMARQFVVCCGCLNAVCLQCCLRNTMQECYYCRCR